MADASVPEPIEVTLCSVEPNNCALEEPVNLRVEVSTNRELLQARWVIMVSSARRLRSAECHVHRAHVRITIAVCRRPGS